MAVWILRLKSYPSKCNQSDYNKRGEGYRSHIQRQQEQASVCTQTWKNRENNRSRGHIYGHLLLDVADWQNGWGSAHLCKGGKQNQHRVPSQLISYFGSNQHAWARPLSVGAQVQIRRYVRNNNAWSCRRQIFFHLLHQLPHDADLLLEYFLLLHLP